MADALCGPVNPLQQFKQQSSLDRTLQQDRLSSRQSPAQGFRSHDPNAGLLDPEFEAFQAGLPAPDLPQYQHFHPQQHSFAGASQAPSWAQDFQQLQISPSAFQQQGPNTARWAQGFRQHIAQSAPRSQQTSSPSHLAFQQRARLGYSGYQIQSASQPSFAPNVQQSKGKEPVHEQFDDAAFEQAFAQAQDEMMSKVDEGSTFNAEMLHAEVSAKQKIELRRQLESERARGEMLDMDRLSQLDGLMQNEQDNMSVAEEQLQTEEQRTQEEQDALAATAQELLEKVENNKTDKFRNSQFLGLMRKLRDREVKIEGDKMVETAADTAAAEPSTLNAPSTTVRPMFDNSEQRPSPLAASTASRPLVDTRPPDYGAHDDADIGRIDPRDGQAVVNLLNQPGAMHDDLGTSHSLRGGEPPFYGDLRTMHGARSESASLSEMLYAHDGTLERPVAWEGW